MASTFSLNEFQASCQSQKSWPFTISAASSLNHIYLCSLTSSRIGLFVLLTWQICSCLVSFVFTLTSMQKEFLFSWFNRCKCLVSNWLPCMNIVHSFICWTSIIKLMLSLCDCSTWDFFISLSLSSKRLARQTDSTFSAVFNRLVHCRRTARVKF